MPPYEPETEKGIAMSSAPTAPLGLLPDIAAEKHGSTVFTSDTPWVAYGRPVNDIADFSRAVHDYADRFWAAGVRPGDVVAVVQRNHVEIQALACGLARIGALPAPLSVRMEAAEILECLAMLDRPVAVMDSTVLPKLRNLKNAMRGLTKKVLYLTPADGAAATVPGFDWLVPTGERQPHQAQARGADEWVLVTHTSGTTALPKLAAHSTRSLYGMVESQVALMRRFGVSALAAKHLTFVHARMSATTLGLLEVAMPLLSIADPDPEHVRTLLLEHRPDSLETHPNIFLQWESLATHPSRPLAPVQRFISTFDAMHPRTIRALLAGSDHPNAQYLQGYGQTETGGVAARQVLRAEIDTYNPRNVGHPIENAAVRVVNAAGEPVPAGEIGFIQSKSPGRFCGYVGEPAAPTKEEWWPMGDLGRQQPDGSLELLDRIVDHLDGYDSLLEKEDQLLELLPELVEVVLLRPVGDADLVAVAVPREGEELDQERFQAAAAKLGLGEVLAFGWKWKSMPLTGSYKVRRSVLWTYVNAWHTSTAKVT